MLKTILLGSALLFAIPALAQTNGTQDSGTATTTNDHDPTMEDDGAAEGTTNAGVSTQVNGGMTSSSTGTGTGAAATQAESHDAINHGNMDHGTAAGTTSGGTMSAGTMSGGTMSGANGAQSGGASAGAGGRMAAAGDYPACSRTRTDSCVQTNERGRRR